MPGIPLSHLILLEHCGSYSPTTLQGRTQGMEVKPHACPLRLHSQEWVHIQLVFFP